MNRIELCHLYLFFLNMPLWFYTNHYWTTVWYQTVLERSGLRVFSAFRVSRCLWLVVWTLFCFLCSFLFLSNSNLEYKTKSNITVRVCVPYHWGSVGHKAFQYLFETIMGCLAPFTLINICYSTVLCHLKKARFHSRGQGSRLILMIICTFAVFWLPYHIVNIIEVIFNLSYLDGVTKGDCTMLT